MNKNKHKLPIGALLMVAAIGLGFFLSAVLPGVTGDAIHILPEDMDTQPPVQQNYDTDIHQGRLPGYENAPENTTPEYFWYLFNSNMTLFGEKTCNVLLENTPGNRCSMQVEFALETGEKIYRSATLAPGEYLLYDTLSAVPVAGDHAVTVSIYVYAEGHEAPIAVYTEQAVLTVSR